MGQVCEDGHDTSVVEGAVREEIEGRLRSRGHSSMMFGSTRCDDRTMDCGISLLTRTINEAIKKLSCIMCRWYVRSDVVNDPMFGCLADAKLEDIRRCRISEQVLEELPAIVRRALKGGWTRGQLHAIVDEVIVAAVHEE